MTKHAITAVSNKLVQGTDEWLAHRRQHYNASDAAAMLGLSPKKKRSELLREVATGLAPEVDEFTQRLFDKGHEYEAQARAWAEEIVGEELYPDMLSADVLGLPLSCSYDGITMLGTITWEHKWLNKELDAALAKGEIPLEYWPQMEQGLMLSGAEKCLFMASCGDKEGMRHAWYEPKEKLRQTLLDGWRQFAADLASYEHKDAPAEAVPAVIKELPALNIQIEGRVIATNMDLFRADAMAFIEKINTDLKTDQHFADAEATVKFCRAAETRLAAAKEQALAQTASIDEVFRALDDVSSQLRGKRLQLEKLVKQRKEQIRHEIVLDARNRLAQHIERLSERLPGNLHAVSPKENFAEAIKNKRTIASLQDAVDTELARLKIEASQIADRMEMNAKSLVSDARDWTYLFPDLQAVAEKAPEDFVAILSQRKMQEAERRERQAAEERARLELEEERRKALEDRETAAQLAVPSAPGQIRALIVERMADYFEEARVPERTQTTLRKHFLAFAEFIAA